MGGTNGKEKPKSSKKAKEVNSKNLTKDKERMKDDYVKFIMREQLRREKEFKDKSGDKDNIYNQVSSKIKKDSSVLQSSNMS